MASVVGEGAQAGQRIEVLVSEWWQNVHSEDGEVGMEVPVTDDGYTKSHRVM